MAELGKDGSSDDEVYNNVDLISESDEGDPAVEEVEERDIIESEEGRARRVPLTPGSPSSADVAGDAGDEWEGFDIDQHGETGHSDLALTHMNPHFADEMEMFHAASAYDRAASTPVSESKRVRFQIDSDVAHSNSSSSSSDSNRGRFQSLFMQQDQLDPQFRHLIENDQDDEEDSSDESGSEGGQWKDQYHDDLGLGVDLEDDSRSEMSQGSLSGYETDEGETTDEDLPPPQSIARTRSVLRGPSSSSDSDDEEYRSAALQTPRSRSSRRIGPSLGSWVADPSKPIAVIDSTGKRMVVYPALRPSNHNQVAGGVSGSDSSTVSSSPQASYISQLADFDVAPSPMIGSNAPFLTGSLLRRHTDNEVYVHERALSSSSAFIPFLAGAFGDPMDFFDDDDDDAGDDDEKMLNVDDFIDFGDDSSSDDDANGNAEANGEVVSPTTSAPQSVLSSQTTSTEHGTASSSDTVTQRMLDHFDRGVVTAFRQNQTHHKLLFSNSQPHDFTSLSAKAMSRTSPYSMKLPPVNGSKSSKRSRSESTGSITSTSTAKTLNVSDGHKRRKMNPF